MGLFNDKQKRMLDMSNAAGAVDKCKPEDRFAICSCNRSGEGDGQIFKVGCKTAPGMGGDSLDEKNAKLEGENTAAMD